MRIIKTKDYNELSLRGARLIAAQILVKPHSILGLATGSSPIGVYENLVAEHQAGILDFSKIRTVNLDEYWGLDPSHDQSYRYFMDFHLFDKVNINKENTRVPNGKASNPQEECEAYSQYIQDIGGIDLQLIGIGSNGHIGFNEPADHFTCGTHVAELTAQTLEDNKRFFPSIDQVPTKAVTMGIREIMQARSVVMVASGKNKAQAVKDSLTGKITPAVPGSILQLHPNFTLVADEEALSLL